MEYCFELERRAHPAELEVAHPERGHGQADVPACDLKCSHGLSMVEGGRLSWWRRRRRLRRRYGVVASRVGGSTWVLRREHG